MQAPEPLSIKPCHYPFYENFCNAIEKDGWILFGHNMPSTSLDKLYIRESYRTIASSINPGISKTVLSGTPGIGKSLFLFYLLWKLVKERKRVLFIYRPFKIYFDGKGGVFYLNKIPFAGDPSFWNDTLWCLFDDRNKNESDLYAIPHELCKFVLSMSPRREMINDFKKPPVPQFFFMPLWTEAELEAIVPCFPEAIDWRKRFKILGGVPRYVLEVTKDDPIKMLREACYEFKLDELIRAGDSDIQFFGKSAIAFPLVHIDSAPQCTSSFVCFASQTALKTCCVAPRRGRSIRSCEE